MSEQTPDPSTPEGDEPTRVSRDAARATSSARNRRKILVIAGIVAVVVLGAGAAVFALTRGGDEKAAPTTTEATTTTTTTTTVPPAVGPTAPLTGVQLAADDAGGAALLNRPAAVVKIDNAPAAMPQIGMQNADVVFELKVEGISRYMAVFHSKDVQDAGPVRSARTSDPDLLAMFVRPIVAWSGGNQSVSDVMNSTPWIQSLNHSQGEPAYHRDRSRSAPHNLVVNLPRLWEFADQPPALPSAVFQYLPEGQDPGGLPVSGLDLHVGESPAAYLWDAAGGTWSRWSNGRRQLDETGAQIAPRNVVVLETAYVSSSADARSPEAVTIGNGNAWVFTQGRVIPGRWERGAPEQPYALTTAEGAPMLLTPGATWVELPET
ncbi:MAG: DUF3048 domain-containing protein, partial [Microthrixaceae bacterium]